MTRPGDVSRARSSPPRSSPLRAGARPRWAWALLTMAPMASAALPIASLYLPALDTPSLHTAEVALVDAGAAAGCVVAATAFEWRDHLARAWTTQGAVYLLLLIRCVLLAAGSLTGSEGAVVADGVLTSVANIGGILAAWMLANTGNLAGLHEVIPPMRRRLTWIMSLVVAWVASGPGLVTSAQHLAHGNAASLVSVASRAGDIVGFVLIAPLLLTTLALRRGLLVWPWALLTASALCWLGADFANAGFLHLPNNQVGPFFNMFRYPACLFVLAAGIAQRWVIDSREL